MFIHRAISECADTQVKTCSMGSPKSTSQSTRWGSFPPPRELNSQQTMLDQSSPHLFALVHLPWLRSCGGPAANREGSKPHAEKSHLGIKQLLAASFRNRHPQNQPLSIFSSLLSSFKPAPCGVVTPLSYWRITECPALEGTHKDHHNPVPAQDNPEIQIVQLLLEYCQG